MRIFKLSDDTILLKLWDKLHSDVDFLVNKPIKDLDNNPAPDISGDWQRVARAMECRNHPEHAGLKSDENPRGSRSEVVPPDVDRTETEAQGKDVAKLLPWHISRADMAGQYVGKGSGSVHDHSSTIVYKGMVHGQHHYFYKTARSIERAFSSPVTAAIYKKLGWEHITTNMFGVIIVEQDAAKNVTQLTSVVTCSDGHDPDLPQRFKEISIWKKAVQLKP